MIPIVSFGRRCLLSAGPIPIRSQVKVKVNFSTCFLERLNAYVRSSGSSSPILAPKNKDCFEFEFVNHPFGPSQKLLLHRNLSVAERVYEVKLLEDTKGDTTAAGETVLDRAYMYTHPSWMPSWRFTSCDGNDHLPAAIPPAPIAFGRLVREVVSTTNPQLLSDVLSRTEFAHLFTAKATSSSPDTTGSEGPYTPDFANMEWSLDRPDAATNDVAMSQAVTLTIPVLRGGRGSNLEGGDENYRHFYSLFVMFRDAKSPDPYSLEVSASLHEHREVTVRRTVGGGFETCLPTPTSRGGGIGFIRHSSDNDGKPLSVHDTRREVAFGCYAAEYCPLLEVSPQSSQRIGREV